MTTTTGPKEISRRQVQPHLAIVIRQRQTVPQFMTHLHNLETGGYSLGHYAHTLGEACQEFARRVKLYS